MVANRSIATKPIDWNRLRAVRRRSWFARDPVQVAQELLGMFLIREDARGRCAGRIVETEAYLAIGDSACHAARGLTRKNASMFGPPGHAYVYAIHSRWCLNVVTEATGVASAVLIRAIEPLVGLDTMADRRGTQDPYNLTRGPARLCEALAVNRGLDGWDLTRVEQLWLAHAPRSRSVPRSHADIVRSTRIGVTSAQQLLLRFFARDNRFVSGHRRGQPVADTQRDDESR